MTAYQNALASPQSTLVLSPNSEFFQYFDSEIPKTTPAPVSK
jgi:hypothetical protein